MDDVSAPVCINHEYTASENTVATCVKYRNAVILKTPCLVIKPLKVATVAVYECSQTHP